jgi:putative hemolysin
MPIREVNRELDIELPEGDAWSTVGGLCMALAGGIPTAGQTLDAPDGTKLVVESATERAVTEVKIVPAKSGGEAPASENSASLA